MRPATASSNINIETIIRTVVLINHLRKRGNFRFFDLIHVIRFRSGRKQNGAPPERPQIHAEDEILRAETLKFDTE